jgi:hypothetical protein
MAQVEVLKPKPVLVPASSVKGYLPEFVGEPGRAEPPMGFVTKLGSPGGYSVGMTTKAPGAIQKQHTNATPVTLPAGRGKITFGRRDPRFVLGVGRTIIPNNGISLGNANGPGI